MAEQNDWVSVMKEIIRQMSTADVTELEVRQGDLRLRLRRAHREAPSLPHPIGPAVTEDSAPDPEALHKVTAPLTGVFYSSPSPSSKDYVSAGDWIDQDTVVGLIETMKVFNEVVADCRGRVVAVQVHQGQLVHAGESLLLVDLGATPDHSEVAT